MSTLIIRIIIIEILFFYLLSSWISIHLSYLSLIIMLLSDILSHNAKTETIIQFVIFVIFMIILITLVKYSLFEKMDKMNFYNLL